MLRQRLSVFFTILFMAFTFVPSVLVLVDNSLDISIFMSVSEEEEEIGKDNNKEFEVFIVETISDSNPFITSESEDNLGYTYKNYPKPHLNLIFPPPEFIL